MSAAHSVQALALQKVKTKHQIAALCYRHGANGLEYLLITSRGSGRWLIPKGWEMQGMPPHKAAAIEAWQEAGVKGSVNPDYSGQFSYFKTLKSGKVAWCTATVFPLHVSDLEKKYPEAHQRRRKWHLAHKAIEKVHEPQLRQIMLNFAMRAKTAN